MPLIKSVSKAARQRNIEREIASGRDPKVAVAIAYSVQRRAKADKIQRTASRMASKGRR